MKRETMKQKADRINAERRKKREELEKKRQGNVSSLSAQDYSDRIMQVATYTAIHSSHDDWSSPSCVSSDW